MSVETERRDLRSFQHCKKDVDLVCFTLPELCPLCQQSTSTTEMRIPPYLLPSPFCSSKKALCSVVLRPTGGDFVRYNITFLNVNFLNGQNALINCKYLS